MDELEDYFLESIRQSKDKIEGKHELGGYLSSFTTALSSALSASEGLRIDVKYSGDDLWTRLSKGRVGNVFKKASAKRPLVRPNEAEHLWLSIEGDPTPREICVFEPDTVSYFPVRIQYGDGTKEIICDNVDEVKQGLKTMTSDNMVSMLEHIQEVKNRTGKQKADEPVPDKVKSTNVNGDK